MTTKLFPAADRYFELMDGADVTRVLDVFTPDAVVLDDGQTYVGHGEILEWLTGPASEFVTTSTWLTASQTGTTAAATIRLEGNFPGSPVDLHYAFTQAASGLISALAITVSCDLASEAFERRETQAERGDKAE